MSISSEITRINNNIAAAYTALDGKGATMPETQNSANLADTIDTITTGGGGGGETPDYMDDYNTMVSTLDTDISAGLTMFSTCQNYGYTKVYTGSYGSSGGFIGFVVDRNYSFAYFRKDSFYAYKIPSTATYTDVDSTWCMITFGASTNPHWIICHTVGKQYPRGTTGNIFYYDFKLTMSTGGNSKTTAQVKCYYNPFLSGTVYLKDFINGVNAFCDIKIIKVPDNFKFDMGSITSAENIGDTFTPIMKLDNVAEFLTHCNGYTDGYYTLSGANVAPACAGGRNNIIPYIKTGTPLILDMSQATATGTLNLVYEHANNSYASPNIQVTDLKIKLPSTYSTVSTAYYDATNSNCGIPFSKEALTYMANNAPTVSSKTIDLGIKISGYLTYSTEGQAIKAIFESKGWTVS